MNLKDFCNASDLLHLSEIERVRLLCFFQYHKHGQHEFSTRDVTLWFDELHMSRPNTSRLANKLRSSRSFVRGSKQSSFRLHWKDLQELEAQFPSIRSPADEPIAPSYTVLPESLYSGTRKFIEAIANQINGCYEYSFFDGCAVLMRRLVEVLLILSYHNLNLESEIHDIDENYVPLDKMIGKVNSNKSLGLSRDSKSALNTFKTLGNFSAHKIYYTCRRSDLEKVLLPFRALIEELLYKSGLK